MIRLCRNVIETARADHAPVERWFGSALRCSINWRSADASERVARVFAPSIGSSGYLCLVSIGLNRFAVVTRGNQR
jgi:hypothetical protein